jgi:hypothetical protein
VTSEKLDGKADSAAGLGRLGGLGEALYEAGEAFYARIDLAVLASGVAGVDALEDDRQLPVAEGDEEVELGEVAAGALGVAVAQLGGGGEAGRQVGGLAEGDQLSPARQ